MMSQQEHKNFYFWATLIAGIIIGSFYLISVTFFYHYGTQTRKLGWDIAVSNGEAKVTHVDRRGPAAGKLQVGDRVLTMNGDPRILVMDFSGTKTISVPAENQYTVGIRRGSQDLSYALPVMPTRDLSGLLRSLCIFIAGFASFAIAFLVGYSRPERGSAQLFTLTWFCVSLLQLAAS